MPKSSKYGYVYVLTNTDKTVSKIGYTMNATRDRCRQFSKCENRQYVLAVEICFDKPRVVEQYLHRFFDHLKIEREFFRVSPTKVEIVAKTVFKPFDLLAYRHNLLHRDTYSKTCF